MITIFFVFVVLQSLSSLREDKGKENVLRFTVGDPSRLWDPGLRPWSI